jgi:YidC/Oxa1 family membrane protein insertase
MIGGYMAIIMLWFGWVSPAGVLLYWDISSIWGVAQQQITMSMTKRATLAAPEDTSSSKKKDPKAGDLVAEKKPANKSSKKAKKS